MGGQSAVYLGQSVDSAGDVNNDNYNDIIVGAYHYSNGESREGRAYVYLGSSTGVSTTPNWTIESNQANAELGKSVAGVGDVNSDGFDDVLVGAPGYDNGQTNEGKAFLYYGSSSGPVTAPSWSYESDRPVRFSAMWSRPAATSMAIIIKI